jgi:hypothetical protein
MIFLFLIDFIYSPKTPCAKSKPFRRVVEPSLRVKIHREADASDDRRVADSEREFRKVSTIQGTSEARMNNT